MKTGWLFACFKKTKKSHNLVHLESEHRNKNKKENLMKNSYFTKEKMKEKLTGDHVLQCFVGFYP